MKIIRGRYDIFSECNSGDAVCVTTNGIVNKNGNAVMGKGIALQAKNLFPNIDIKLGSYLKEHGNRVFNLGVWNLNGKIIRVFSYPTKHHWKDPSDVTLICKSAEELALMVESGKFSISGSSINNILLPAVGCGNGGLIWEVSVEPWLSNILIDDSYVAYVP